MDFALRTPLVPASGIGVPIDEAVASQTGHLHHLPSQIWAWIPPHQLNAVEGRLMEDLVELPKLK